MWSLRACGGVVDVDTRAVSDELLEVRNELRAAIEFRDGLVRDWYVCSEEITELRVRMDGLIRLLTDGL